MPVYPPEQHPHQLEKFTVALPVVTGTLYVGTGYRHNPEARALPVLCSPFSLPAPNTLPAEDFYRRLAHASISRADAFGKCLHSAVDEAVKTHAIVHRVGVDHPQRPPLVRPVIERVVGPYILYYGTLFSDYSRTMEDWPHCLTCRDDYAYHVEDMCPGYLGERFKTARAKGLAELTRLLVFANNLQTWVNKHTDSIFHLALERLDGQQKTSPYTGGHARGEFTPFIDSTEARGSATTGDGTSDPVPGERGDHGDR